jgi:polysaccharide export outer membrane protein
MKIKSLLLFAKLVIPVVGTLVLGVVCPAQGPDDKVKGAVRAEGDPGHESLDAPMTAAKGVAHDDNFVIGSDDVLSVSVWKEAEISRTVTVRSDGKISLPLAGELEARNKTPKQLETEISSKLSPYLSEPTVTVIVQEIRSRRFNILGQVAHPGSYVLNFSTTVLDAIALGGGFRDFAKQKAIFILRRNPDGSQSRIAFNYKEIVKGHRPEQNLVLQSGDTVVVP